MKVKQEDRHASSPGSSLVREALVEMQSELRKIYGLHAPILLVYGSYARGEASADSDVDVVLLYSKEVQPGKEIHQLREILSVLNLRYQVLISILPISAQHYQDAPSAFLKNVRREAVPIDHF
jgi:uncharacterized protein